MNPLAKMLVAMMSMSLLPGHGLMAQSWNKVFVEDFILTAFYGVHVDSASNDIYADLIYQDWSQARWQSTGLMKISSNGEYMGSYLNGVTDTTQIAAGPNKSIIEMDSHLITVSDMFNLGDYSTHSEYFELNIVRKDFSYGKTLAVYAGSKGISPRFARSLADGRLLVGGVDNRHNTVNLSEAFLMVVDTLGQVHRKVRYKTFPFEQWSAGFFDAVVEGGIIRVASTAYNDEYLVTLNYKPYFSHFVLTYDTGLYLQNVFASVPDSLNFDNLSSLYPWQGGYVAGAAHIRHKFVDSQLDTVWFFDKKERMNLPAMLAFDQQGQKTGEFIDTLGVPYPYSGFVDFETGKDGSLYGLAFDYSLHDRRDLLKLPNDTLVWKHMLQANLYKWSSDMKLQWVRHIRYPEAKSTGSTCTPKDMTVLDDGTILIAGHYTPGQFDGQYGSKAWLVRTDSNGCVEGQPCINYATVGLEEPPTAAHEAFSVWPNPYTGGNLTANIETEGGQKHALLISTEGRLSATVGINGQELEIPAHIPNGAYTLLVLTASTLYHSKLIIQR